MPDAFTKRKFLLVHYYRGIAALFVLLYHFSACFFEKFHYQFFFGIFLIGHIGIDFFFILSGFLISYQHYDDVGFPSRIRTYLKKRFLRIYPTYWVIFIITLCAYLLLLTPLNLNTQYYNPALLIKSFLLLPQKQHNYFIEPAWTLAYEVGFYLIFSLLILLPSVAIMKKILAIIGICLLFVNYGLLILFQADGMDYAHHINQYILTYYILEFVGGCIIGCITRTTKLSIVQALSILFLGTGMFIFSSYLGLHNPGLTNDYYRALFFGLPLALIIYGSIQYEKHKKICSIRPLVLIGNASYPIYLIHSTLLFGLYRGVQRLYNGNNTIIITALFLGSICLALSITLIYYKLIDKPLFQKLSSRFSS